MSVLQVFSVSGTIFVMNLWSRPASFWADIFYSGVRVMRKPYKTLASTEK
jgi:hypothetical protein